MPMTAPNGFGPLAAPGMTANTWMGPPPPMPNLGPMPGAVLCAVQAGVELGKLGSYRVFFYKKWLVQKKASCHSFFVKGRKSWGQLFFFCEFCCQDFSRFTQRAWKLEASRCQRC